MGLRIGIDCDGVLRDFIPDLIDGIKTTHPQHTDKILVPRNNDVPLVIIVDINRSDIVITSIEHAT